MFIVRVCLLCGKYVWSVIDDGMRRVNWWVICCLFKICINVLLKC